MGHFRERPLPQPGEPVGYAALVDRYDLQVPLPPRLTAIADRHHPDSTPEWQMLAPNQHPGPTLQEQLEFAVKWEGISLGVLAVLFDRIDPVEVEAMVREKPTGANTRRIWFLYEWLTDDELDLPDAGKVKAVPVLDPEQQFGLADAPLSRRHRVRNNLPGTPEFCPLVRRTPALDEYLARGLDEQAREVIGRTPRDIVRRAAGFLLLADSKASFEIEGESPSRDRARRWAEVIERAGHTELSVETLVDLQEWLISDARFVEFGLRSESGWLGDRDRLTNEPIPEHISARPEDVPELVRGVVEYERRVGASDLDPVAAAATIAFGFVYIHPFEDGNGRIHRWLIHHVLARAGFNPPGLVFPVSASMLRHIEEYRTVLRSYSEQILPLIEWHPTDRGNVEVENDTADFYRFFDATAHAEFLYGCVEETVTRDLPREVAYLEGFEEFSTRIQEDVADMPEKTINLLTGFLDQNDGRLSKRARTREFEDLSPEEVERIEELYEECFPDDAPRAVGR